MKSITLLLVLLAALCCSYAAADCSVSVQQTLGSAWKQDGVDMSQWNAQLTAGSAAVKSVQLAITGAGGFTQLWELTRTSAGLYVLPDYRLQSGGLPAGQVHHFGYIWKSASPATITVASIDCGSASASPSPSPAPSSPSSSPSPSAAPASPSAAPSIVATPQPSQPPSGDNGCSAIVELTARSAANGGVWTDAAGRTYQIFQVLITNRGQRPVNGGVITFDLVNGAEISQYWELNRQGPTSPAFNIAFNYGQLQPGASQGAGVVVSSAAKPSFTLSSVACA
ncbi:carbohydrate binding domain cbm49 protein [Acanthamoeba castellanii str. Neff]|uniref:Carbohydrate binding domain cbm49 protein n=1 Tax=Acanthamoeba castellanii (strain ATCC 30010 / Neff) TaxID=1257118 RepID=L8H247_ACACF|nr:carbohydrate binding domain cbm49 protein [Acanthamoeba castellanii str. Neff]ELR19554.1 carbohydrate binding domain cbm49 protein [Acanthamoeba castellanii str. Neff]